MKTTLFALSFAALALTVYAQAPQPDFSKVEIKTTKVTNNFYSLDGQGGTIGVLVGTSMMWVVFERFYPRWAGDEMVRVFVRNLRLMAELTSDTPANADSQAIFKIRRQREQIYRNFGEVNAQSDAVPFETGDRR